MAKVQNNIDTNNPRFKNNTKIQAQAEKYNNNSYEDLYKKNVGYDETAHAQNFPEPASLPKQDNVDNHPDLTKIENNLYNIGESILKYTEIYGTLDVNRLRNLAYSSNKEEQAAWVQLRKLYVDYNKILPYIPWGNRHEISNLKYVQPILSNIKEVDSLITEGKNYSTEGKKIRYSSNYEDINAFIKSNSRASDLAKAALYYGNIINSIANEQAKISEYEGKKSSYNSADRKAADKYFKMYPKFERNKKAAMIKYSKINNTVIALKKVDPNKYYNEFIPVYLDGNPYWEPDERIVKIQEQVKRFNNMNNGGMKW